MPHTFTHGGRVRAFVGFEADAQAWNHQSTDAAIGPLHFSGGGDLRCGKCRDIIPLDRVCASRAVRINADFTGLDAIFQRTAARDRGDRGSFSQRVKEIHGIDSAVVVLRSIDRFIGGAPIVVLGRQRLKIVVCGQGRRAHKEQASHRKQQASQSFHN